MRNPKSGPLLTLITAFVWHTAPAAADQGTGGIAYGSAPPTVTSAACSPNASWSCSPGDQLVLRGSDLMTVKTVEFLGGPGTRDDRRATPRRTTDHRLELVVPVGAATGPLRARTPDAASPKSRLLRIDGDTTTAAAVDGMFPITGRHDMGQSKNNRFGGPRKHGGQDLFAACGTPLVAVRDGTVQHVAYQKRAGNYVVLRDTDGRSYAYMHMRKPALVELGQTLTAGQQVGEVGQTGRATGCHLHFELWTAPGWNTGGQAIDPLPQLKAWETAEKPHR